MALMGTEDAQGMMNAMRATLRPRYSTFRSTAIVIPMRNLALTPIAVQIRDRSAAHQNSRSWKRSTKLLRPTNRVRSLSLFVRKRDITKT